MSLGFTDIEEQARHLRVVVSQINNTAMVEETNKRGIVWCEDYYTANLVRLNAERDGYQVVIRKGLKSNHYYASCYY